MVRQTNLERMSMSSVMILSIRSDFSNIEMRVIMEVFMGWSFNVKDTGHYVWR